MPRPVSTKIMMKGLSYEDSCKYQAAIRRGYLDDYEENPRAWRQSFVGAFITKHHNRIPVLDMLRQICGHTPTWEDLDDSTLRELTRVLSEHYSSNTARNRCAEIRAVINSFDGEVNMPSVKFSKILRVKPEASENIYLTLEELKRIINYTPLTENERYVKKIFLIEAFTGARNCDSIHLSGANCNPDNDMLHYVSRKTHRDITLPVWAPVVPYLNDDCNSFVTLATFNYLLRGICQKCGICDIVSVWRCGEQRIGEKWNYVSSHTGRRSYATNLYVSGIDPCTIAEWMGHSDPDITIKRYIIGHREISDDARKFFMQQI